VQLVGDVGVGEDELGQQAGSAAEVERLPPALAEKEADVLVPVGAGRGRQFGPDRVEVHLAGVRRAALAEEGEKGVVIEGPTGGGLQFQEGVLDGVHVHGVDLAAAGQQVVQGVAAGAGDDQEAVVGPEIEGLAVQGRVFPAGVVNEVVAVDRPEDARVELFLGGVGADHAWINPL
jgi:hypothetical protein